MRRCLFLDRDGVINAAPPTGEYIRSWDEFRLLPQVISWIRLFKAAGYLENEQALSARLELAYFNLADRQPELASADLLLREHNRGRWKLLLLPGGVSAGMASAQL